MIPLVAVTQNVMIVPEKNERRDALDQRWIRFLGACGLTLLPIPNKPEAAAVLVRSAELSGILFTGGNDLSSLGGDAPERDQTERMLLEYALSRPLPLLGVCRGMQVIQEFFGIPLKRVEGHVCQKQVIRVNTEETEVNSYHRWGTTETHSPLTVWAVAPADGVVKAIRHETKRLQGIMWHPERRDPFSRADIALVTGFFLGSSA